jgi:hypothetical protein
MTDPIAIQMNVTRAFSEGSGATWLTSMPQDSSIEEINTISDKIMAALARQDTWARIALLNNEIEMHTKQKAQIDFSLASLEEKHGDFTACNKDIRAAYNQSKEGLLRIVTLISALVAEQARLQQLLGG